MPEESVSHSWKSIPGFPDYEINLNCEVRRVTDVERAHRTVAGVILKSRPRSMNGRSKYLYVSLRNTSRKRVCCSIHRLMLLTFIGPPPTPKHQAAHKDDKFLNNKIENLYWATHRENTDDRTRNGRSLRGEANGNAKLTDEQVALLKIELRHPQKRGYLKQRAAELSISTSTLKRIRSGAIHKYPKFVTQEAA